MNRHTPIAIVGGGPCGLLTALLLARHGVACELFEAKDGLSTHPKAMGISRRTAEILRELGLLSIFEERSLALEDRDLTIWSRTLTGEILGRIPLAGFSTEFSPCHALHCPQTIQEQILFEALGKEPAVQLNFGCRIEEVRLTDQGGELISPTGETITFDWLVAADGAASPLRRRWQIPAHGPGDMGHFLNILFRAPLGERLEDRRALLYNCVWPEGFENFVAIDGGETWLMHHFLAPESHGVDLNNEELAACIRTAAGWPDLPVEILSVHSWVMSPKLAGNFRYGRAFLVGDAAARLSPAGGLGLNTGMQSAHNLAWKLAWVVRGEAGEALLDSYDQERRQHSSHILRHTNQNAGEIFAIVSEASRENWDGVRNLIAHSLRAGTGFGLDFGWNYTPETPSPPLPGEDPANQYQPCAQPGRRAPHLPVGQAGPASSLLDFFGREFVLLTPSSGQLWEGAGKVVRVLQEGRDFQSFTGESSGSSTPFESIYALSGEGAVMVRPDGTVCARFHQAPHDPAGEIEQTLRRVLHLPPA